MLLDAHPKYEGKDNTKSIKIHTGLIKIAEKVAIIVKYRALVDNIYDKSGLNITDFKKDKGLFKALKTLWTEFNKYSKDLVLYHDPQWSGLKDGSTPVTKFGSGSGNDNAKYEGTDNDDIHNKLMAIAETVSKIKFEKEELMKLQDKLSKMTNSDFTKETNPDSKQVFELAYNIHEHIMKKGKAKKISNLNPYWFKVGQIPNGTAVVKFEAKDGPNNNHTYLYILSKDDPKHFNILKNALNTSGLAFNV